MAKVKIEDYTGIEIYTICNLCENCFSQITIMNNYMMYYYADGFVQHYCNLLYKIR